MPSLTRAPTENAAAAAAAAAARTEQTFPAAIPTRAPNWMAATKANSPLSDVTPVPVTDEQRLFKMQQEGNFATIMSKWATNPVAGITVANADNTNEEVNYLHNFAF